MKKTLIIGISAILLSMFASAEDTKTTAIIEREAGNLALQLLNYDWEAESDAVVVPTNALASFKFFSSNAVAKAYAPPEAAKISFHRRTEKTCDAIRMVYENDGLAITLIQTRLTMLLIVKGADSTVSDLSKADAVANRLAGRLINWPEHTPLVITNVDNKLSIGRPGKSNPDARRGIEIEVPPKRKSTGGFILDSWWSDGNEIAFFGVKAPSNSDGLIMMDRMKSMERNHRWF